MRSTLLIAWREYKQYILSRGFLIFLIMFPLGVIIGGGAVGLAQSAQPARHFVVFDETGDYGAIIEREIELRRMRGILAAWNAYLEIAVPGDALENGAIPAPFAKAPVTSARVEAFIAAGGVEAGNAAIKPYLREGVPPFVMRKSSMIRIDVPRDVAAATNLSEASDLLRPYLLGEKQVVDGSGE
ncbi:MAG: hypothetical protein AAGJ87_17160, partial [Pseudomonadota bacterium]